MRNWPVADRTLRDAELGPVIPFGVATLPGGSAALGGQNLAVSATTDMPKASRALVEFLTDARSRSSCSSAAGCRDPQDRLHGPRGPVGLHHHAGRRTRRRAHPPGRPALRGVQPGVPAEVDAYVRRDQPVRDEDIRARLEAALQGREPPQPS